MLSFWKRKHFNDESIYLNMTTFPTLKNISASLQGCTHQYFIKEWNCLQCVLGMNTLVHFRPVADFVEQYIFPENIAINNINVDVLSRLFYATNKIIIKHVLIPTYMCACTQLTCDSFRRLCVTPLLLLWQVYMILVVYRPTCMYL